jgi:hypothetical protein
MLRTLNFSASAVQEDGIQFVDGLSPPNREIGRASRGLGQSRVSVCDFLRGRFAFAASRKVRALRGDERARLP